MLVLSTLAAAISIAGQSDYDVIVLHQPEMNTSLIRASSNGIHSGMVGVGFEFRAATWKGISSSYDFIGPSGVTSRILDAFGDYQLGNTDPGERATVWQSTLSSHTMILPVGPTLSKAFSLQGEQMVGRISNTTYPQGAAALWHQGTYISLHPTSGYSQSEALITDGIYQYGTATTTGGTLRRFRWKGSAASGEIYPVVPTVARNGQMIASVNVSGIGFMRGVWTPTSFVPLGMSNVTDINSTSGLFQCGDINAGGDHYRATVWQGTPESEFNLHSLLPPEYITSNAEAVDEDGNVYGHASKFLTSPDRCAIIWKRRGASTTLVPARATVITGIKDTGQLGDMLWSNDTYLEVLPSYAGARLDPNITIETDHPSGVSVGSALRVRVESAVNSPGIERSVHIYNWNTSSWDLLDVGIAPQTDEQQEIVVSQGISNYLGSQGVKVRMNWRSTAVTGSRTWRAKMDNIRVVIDPPAPGRVGK